MPLRSIYLGNPGEIISKRALRSLLNRDLTTEQREIGTLYIRQHGSEFSINRWRSQYAAPAVQLAFETTADLSLLQDVIEHVPDPDAPSVLAYLAKHPLLALSNQGSGGMLFLVEIQDERPHE